MLSPLMIARPATAGPVGPRGDADEALNPDTAKMKSTLLKEKIIVYKLAAMDATSHHPNG